MPSWMLMQVLNALTPHSVVPTAVKAGIAACIIITAFLAFALATRNYVWVVSPLMHVLALFGGMLKLQ